MKPLLPPGTRVRYIGPDITALVRLPVWTFGTITRYHGTAAELKIGAGDFAEYAPDERLYQIRWDTLEWGCAQFDSRIEPLD